MGNVTHQLRCVSLTSDGLLFRAIALLNNCNQASIAKAILRGDLLLDRHGPKQLRVAMELQRGGGGWLALGWF